MAQDTTIAGFDAALKDVYQGPVRNQLNTKTRLLDLFTKGDVEQYEWEGRQLVLTLHKSRNAGVMATNEDSYLPAAGRQGYANLKVPMRFLHGRIEVTAQVIKASRSDKGAFIRAMDSEQKGLVEDMSRARNRMLSGFGKGILAVINGAANAAQQTVKNPGGVAGTVNCTRFIKVGQVVAIVDPTGVTLRGTQKVNSVDSDTQFTMAAAVNALDGDLVVLGVDYGSGAVANAYGIEPMGILGIADSTTYVSNYFTLDRSQAANAFFRSIVMPNIGGINEDVLQRGIDNAEEISGEVIDTFLCHVSLRRELLKLTQADRRYNVQPGQTVASFDAGTKVGAQKGELSHNGIPIKVDKDFAYGTLIGLNKEHLFWVPEVEGEWAADDGHVLIRVNNKDNYEARYRLYENYFSDKGNTFVRFDGVSVTVTTGIVAD